MLGFEALVVGGDGSMTIAQELHECGSPSSASPRPSTSDLAATMMTVRLRLCGGVRTDALDRLHSTAGAMRSMCSK
jgi:6-phosphofructokinase 1